MVERRIGPAFTGSASKRAEAAIVYPMAAQLVSSSCIRLSNFVQTDATKAAQTLQPVVWPGH
jgi:hypothetical protein